MKSEKGEVEERGRVVMKEREGRRIFIAETRRSGMHGDRKEDLILSSETRVFSL